MDVGLIGAGILSGVLGAHITTVLREQLSLGTWIDSLVGILGGGACAQIVIVLSSAWADTTAGFAIGRIAAVVAVGIAGGGALLLIAGLFRPKRSAPDNGKEAPPPLADRRASSSDRRQGERRVSETDL